MDWNHDFRDDGILELKCNGKFSNSAFLKIFLQVTSDPMWRPGMNVLADFRDVNFDEVQFDDIIESIDVHVQFNEFIGESKIAAIHLSDNGLRLGKIYEVISRLSVKSKINTFKNYEDAVEWVQLHEK